MLHMVQSKNSLLGFFGSSMHIYIKFGSNIDQESIGKYISDGHIYHTLDHSVSHAHTWDYLTKIQPLKKFNLPNTFQNLKHSISYDP